MGWEVGKSSCLTGCIQGKDAADSINDRYADRDKTVAGS
jgi:hypothetical protein